MCEPTTIRPDTTLAELATTWAGASRVFQRHELDFCCKGQRTLAQACQERRLPVDEVVADLQAELSRVAVDVDWRARPLSQQIVHVVDTWHTSHRAELPRLITMAEKVEHVHAGREGCPTGLAAHLRTMAHDLEEHMQKEEQVLFPLLLTGAGVRAAAPIRCLTAEHDEHGRALARTRELAHGFVPPPAACGTWRALYLGLEELERAVMEHVHFENHLLFPHALSGSNA